MVDEYSEENPLNIDVLHFIDSLNPLVISEFYCNIIQ